MSHAERVSTVIERCGGGITGSPAVSWRVVKRATAASWGRTRLSAGGFFWIRIVRKALRDSGLRGSVEAESSCCSAYRVVGTDIGLLATCTGRKVK
jgi:hypothetical protein